MSVRSSSIRLPFRTTRTSRTCGNTWRRRYPWISCAQLELLALKDRTEHLAQLELLEIQAKMDKVEEEATQDLLVPQEHQDRMETPAHQDKTEHLELQEHDRAAILVQLARQDQQEHLAHLDKTAAAMELGHQDRLDHLVGPVTLERMEVQERQDNLVPLEVPARTLPIVLVQEELSHLAVSMEPLLRMTADTICVRHILFYLSR
ncbi:hypothetical protein TELCIR_15760 [Teladorsagia circumcincta]|uniref:Uncharacterized protein n=1 Tax=Teladorsagia circumcincta TaxID=45464 RepID=A0A2G9TXN2_TELCI|nr:hypothetical protein TELCIR_15760 [Teladorsagia circumcincta]